MESIVRTADQAVCGKIKSSAAQRAGAMRGIEGSTDNTRTEDGPFIRVRKNALVKDPAQGREPFAPHPHPKAVSAPQRRDVVDFDPHDDQMDTFLHKGPRSPPRRRAETGGVRAPDNSDRLRCSRSPPMSHS